MVDEINDLAKVKVESKKDAVVSVIHFGAFVNFPMAGNFRKRLSESKNLGGF